MSLKATVNILRMTDAEDAVIFGVAISYFTLDICTEIRGKTLTTTVSRDVFKQFIDHKKGCIFGFVDGVGCDALARLVQARGHEAYILPQYDADDDNELSPYDAEDAISIYRATAEVHQNPQACKLIPVMSEDERDIQMLRIDHKRAVALYTQKQNALYTNLQELGMECKRELNDILKAADEVLRFWATQMILDVYISKKYSKEEYDKLLASLSSTEQREVEQICALTPGELSNTFSPHKLVLCASNLKIEIDELKTQREQVEQYELLVKDTNLAGLT